VDAPDGNADTLFVSVDGQPAEGYYWDVDSGTRYFDTVNAGDLADPLRISLTAGAHTVTFHMREDGVALDTVELIPAELIENEYPTSKFQ
jgi:hypothetical protein